MSAAEIPSLDPNQSAVRDVASVRITQPDQVDLRDVPAAEPGLSVVRARPRSRAVECAQSAGYWLGRTQSGIRRNARAAVARARAEALRIKTQRPLQVLAISAGAAFALGMIVRFWRCHSS